MAGRPRRSPASVFEAAVAHTNTILARWANPCEDFRYLAQHLSCSIGSAPAFDRFVESYS